jgi:hypothetical protein
VLLLWGLDAADDIGAAKKFLREMQEIFPNEYSGWL